MARVKVYRFKVWSQTEGRMVESARMGTADAIWKLETAERIEGPALEVDGSLIDGEGLTRVPMD